MVSKTLPTLLDNGIRSPRKLIRQVVERLLGGEPLAPPLLRKVVKGMLWGERVR